MPEDNGVIETVRFEQTIRDFREHLREEVNEEDYLVAPEEIGKPRPGSEWTPQPYLEIAARCNGKEVYFRQFQSAMIAEAKEKGVAEEEIEERCNYVWDRFIKPEGYNGMPILNKINQLLEDDDTAGHITLLPLMCGAGKSTAISQKIREVLESDNPEANDNKGILIVTDSIERMDGYLKPNAELNPELAEYLKRNEERVCTLRSGDDPREANRVRAKSPVLLMTTQRFFQSSKQKIQELYLKWDRGTRPVILFDEHIPLLEVKQISRTSINEVASALADGIEYTLTEDNEENGAAPAEVTEPNMWLREEKKWCIEQWENVRQRIYAKVDMLESLFPTDPEYTVFVSWEGQFMTEDDDRFFRFLEYKKENLYKDTHKPLDTIKAVQSMFATGSLYHCAKVEKRYENAFSVMIDHTDLVMNLTYDGENKVRMILLDGTGDIHPDLGFLPEGLIRHESGDKYDRMLDPLCIHIVDIATGRTTLEGNSKSAVNQKKSILKYLEKVAQENPNTDDPKPIVFTYQRIEPYFKAKRYKTEHFNNIKGKNDFAKTTTIVQVGLNRMPEWCCLVYYLAIHPEMLRELQERSRVDLAGTKGRIEEIKGNTDELDELAARFIFCDLEQNIFRCAIRSVTFVGMAHYYVLTKKGGDRTYTKLVQMMRQRYVDKGAALCEEPFPEECIPPEKRTRADEVMDWLNEVFSDGREFSFKDIEEHFGYTQEQISKMRQHDSIFKEYLDTHQIPHTRRFRIT